MTPASVPRTTRFTRTITTIADIVALEQLSYDELIPARNLYHVFQATAALHGERPALTVLAAGDPEKGAATLSHKELLDAITRSANLFRSLGITPAGGVVAFLCPALPPVPSALIGAQVAGVASSINFLLNADAVADLLIAENATVLVIPSAAHDAALWEKASAVVGRVPSLQHVLVIGGQSDPARRTLSFEESVSAQPATLDFKLTADRDTVCALFHTGGTTGRPKLVRLTHGNQIHAAWSFAQVHGLDERDVAINGFPLFHVGGTVTTGLSILAAGGHMIIPSPLSLRLPRVIENYWGIVEHFGATIVSGVPTSIAALAEVPIGKRNVASVRMALTGGAVCPKAVGERFEARTGMRLFETYGMTETAAAIAFNPGRGEPLAGSVGFRAPYAKTLIAAFGSEDGNPKACAPLTSGLVLVQGPQVFPGYVDPKHNAGVLTGAGWLITGDIGYLTEDERLVLTGRAKDLIVRSGHNIDPAAIEDVANVFPGVQISSAVGMPDQYAGEVPILFAVAAPGQTIDLPGLQMHLERAINEPPAKPKRVVVLDALPVTAVGKIFKPALRDFAIREKAKLEIERLFGEGVKAEITVDQDDRLNTRVRIVVDSSDDARLGALSESLASLPQSYLVEGRRASSSFGADVLLERAGGIAVVTLNRPNALNALSQTVMQALDGVLDELRADATLRAVIVTGQGRAFSAGGDLLEFHEQLHASPQRLIETLAFNQRVFGKLEALPVPVIGAVNGTAVAGGLELLLCCDVLIAAEDAKLGDGHAKYAVVPAGGATVRLFRKIPANRAMQLFFSAGLVSARELCDWGLINEVVPAPQLLARAKELASQFTRQSPEVLAHIKHLARAYFAAAPYDGFQAELAAFERHIGGKDLAEGLAAFRGKRQPRY